jgi:hypothetical protein
MTERAITLRAYLTGELNDIVESVHIGPSVRCSHICKLVSMFVDYHEEGAKLFLDAFLTDDIKYLIEGIPDKFQLKLGLVDSNENGLQEAIKQTAPLIIGCWKMYITPVGDMYEFGVFRDSGNPLNASIDTAIGVGEGTRSNYIRVSKLGNASVRVSSSIGNSTIVHFTNEQSETDNESWKMDTLYKSICSGLDENKSRRVLSYLKSIISASLRLSHGALIAVTINPEVPPFLEDCTRLSPSIDIADIVNNAQDNPQLIPQLSALGFLINGIFSCDGVVVVDLKARLLAYRGFVALNGQGANGGARRRAYDELSKHVGNELYAAFYQSHDGGNELKIKES